MKYIIIFLLLSLSAAGQQEFFHAQNKGLLLDEYPSAAAAYSLRRVNSSYTGALIRVRRDSTGQAEQDIGSIGEALDTVALKAFVRNNSGYVTTWYDQSGNARNATQTTAANQPRIVDAGAVEYLNNKPAIFFRSTANNFLSVPSSTATFKFLHDGTKSMIGWVGRAGVTSNPLTLNSILQNNSLGSFVGFYFAYDDRTLNDAINYLAGTPTSVARLNTANTFPVNIQVMTTLLLDLSNATAANRAIFKVNNGTELKNNTSTTAPSTANAGENLFFGRNGLGLVGNMQEVLLFNTDQTTNRAQIERNINSYYAIY